MSEKERQVQELKKWCQELLDNFRKEFETLDEIEKSHIPNSRDYSYPCQIEFFLVSEPLEYQLFINMHDPSRKDGEIIINGPFLGDELISKVIEIMDEPRWKKDANNIINETISGFDDYIGNQETKYSDILLTHISNLIITLRNDPTANFKKGDVGGQMFGDRGWGMGIKGNIVELIKTDSLVSESIKDAKLQAARIRDNKELKLIPNSKREDRKYLDVFGAYYYPGVRIGDNLELTFKEKLINIIGKPIYLPEAEFKFNFNGKNGFFDTFGFVGIQSENEKEAIKILNTIFGVSIIFGFDSLSIREFELYSMKMDPKSLSIGGFSWNEENSKRLNPYSSHGSRKIAIPLESMNEIVSVAEKVSNDKTTNELLLFLLESFTHFYNYEFSQSFLFSWLVAEKYISQLFEEVLSENEVSNTRKKKFKNHEKWSTESKIEILNFTGKINSNKYDFLIKYNTKRNKFAHEGESIHKQDSKDLLEFSKNILKNDIDRIMKD